LELHFPAIVCGDPDRRTTGTLGHPLICHRVHIGHVNNIRRQRFNDEIVEWELYLEVSGWSIDDVISVIFMPESAELDEIRCEYAIEPHRIRSRLLPPKSLFKIPEHVDVCWRGDHEQPLYAIGPLGRGDTREGLRISPKPLSTPERRMSTV
jgi:hypothetical protein